MENEATSAMFCLVPFIALALLFVYALVYRPSGQGLHSEERPKTKPSSLLWTLPFAAGLTFLAIWSANGLLTASPIAIIGSSIVMLAAGCVCWSRERILDAFECMPAPVRAIRNIIILVLVVGCCFLAIELPWNLTFPDIYMPFPIVECTIIALSVCALYFLAQRRGVAAAFIVAIFMLIGLAEYFVLGFKGEVIRPGDLLAIKTAATVGANYRYIIDTHALAGITAALVGIALLALLRPKPHGADSRTSLGVRRVICILIGIALVVGTVAFIRVPSYRDDFGASINYWSTRNYYQHQALLPTFILEVQDLVIDVPDGYSDMKADQLQAEYAKRYDDDADVQKRRSASTRQFDKLKPNIVVVMNESFCDLSVLDELRCGYKGPEYFNTRFNDTIVKENASVSAFGGGTANSEFEFLTSCSLTSLGAGIYPYQTFELTEFDTLPEHFSSLGYKTTVMHPNLATNWDRDKRYPEMGFETYLDIDDFEGDPVFHNGVTDAATYDKVLETLTADDSPQFVFDVTMQNHGGYEVGNIPVDQLTDLKPDGLNESMTAQVNEFVSCIAASDRDLEAFIKKLRELDEPTVLVFFGDHHPIISRDINNAYFPDEPGAKHWERIQQTSCAIWANYDIDGIGTNGKMEGNIGVDALGAQMLDLIGAPMTEFHKFQLGIREDVPALNLFGYQTPDGEWHSYDETTDASQALSDFLIVEHRNYGSKL